MSTQLLAIIEIRFNPGQRRTPTESAFGNILQAPSLYPGFLLVHHGTTIIPGGRLTSARSSQALGDSAAPSGELLGGAVSPAVGLTAEEPLAARSQPDSCLRSGSIVLAATHWPSSQLPVCQGRSSRHRATVNVCWRWSNLAWWQLPPCSLPETRRGSESVGSSVDWEEQPMKGPPKVSLILLAKRGISAPYPGRRA